MITKSNRKDDRHDARTLARLARIDADVGASRIAGRKRNPPDVIRARAELVSARTAWVNAGTRVGEVLWPRLPKCALSGEPGASRGIEHQMREVLEPLLKESNR